MDLRTLLIYATVGMLAMIAILAAIEFALIPHIAPPEAGRWILVENVSVEHINAVTLSAHYFAVNVVQGRGSSARIVLYAYGDPHACSIRYSVENGTLSVVAEKRWSISSVFVGARCRLVIEVPRTALNYLSAGLSYSRLRIENASALRSSITASYSSIHLNEVARSVSIVASYSSVHASIHRLGREPTTVSLSASYSSIYLTFWGRARLVIGGSSYSSISSAGCVGGASTIEVTASYSRVSVACVG